MTAEDQTLHSGDCAVTVKPHLGGKIASILWRSHELLQTPLNPYAPRTMETPFSDSDASAWDECLPSVAACTVDTPSGPAHIPDHGDLWRLNWETISSTEDNITLRTQAQSLPLQLERTLSLHTKNNVTRLSLAYTLTNTGQHPTPWAWAAHPLFAVAKGDRIQLPRTLKSLRIEGSTGNRLGLPGEWVEWPRALTISGYEDLSLTRDISAATGDKLFAGPLKSGENWATLERPSIACRIETSFDAAATPYLGLWICYGGWPEKDEGKKQYCVALEPTTAPVDSLAIQGEWSRTLAPGESAQWPMHITIRPTN